MSDIDTAANEEVEQTTTSTESAPVENKTPDDGSKDEQVTDTSSAVQKDDGELVAPETDSNKDESKADDTADKSQADDTDGQSLGEQTDQAQADWNNLSGKAQDRFRQKINENKALQEQLERIQASDTQVATEQELLGQVNPETGDYFTPAEAERIARQYVLEQTQTTNAQRQYELQVQQNQAAISAEAQTIAEDYKFLNETSSEFNPQLAKSYEDLLGDNLLYELPDGNRYTANTLLANGINLSQVRLVGSNISPLKLAKLVHDSTQANNAKNRAEAQRSTEKMLANADNPGGAGQGKKSFSSLSTEEMAEALRSKGHDI